MEELIRLGIGVLILILGIPIGDLLARLTPEELKDGRKWFYLLIFLSLSGAVTSLIILNDVLLFTFLFIAIVTSRSIKIRRKIVKKEIEEKGIKPVKKLKKNQNKKIDRKKSKK